MTGVVVLLLFVCPSSLAIVSKDFKANSFHDDKLFNDSLVSESPSMSVLYCASMCGPNCSYYGFNFKTKKCRAHTCFALVNSVEEEGWRYYSSNDLDCKPKDCQAVYQAGHRRSGVYRIYPSGGASTDVICDMETIGGGWTNIQNRFDGSVNFNRTWNDYKNGFGSATGEYWIGNDVIHELTKTNTSSLYVSITLTNNTTLFELYETFSVSSENDNYRLFVEGQASGTLGNMMVLSSDPHYTNKGMVFSTLDRDNDNSPNTNCASSWKGGWWFNRCSLVFLNGPYASSSWEHPWKPLKGDMIKKTSMLLRRR
uniref:Fibrinogen C-terminal domain-containing protein n=1 Tax=Magallana gigas TaxID=29159 RepID=A0A8W8MZS7_MAGGI|nr:microfibril-associated glycoprotein 4 [Crassostrea gigas]